MSKRLGWNHASQQGLTRWSGPKRCWQLGITASPASNGAGLKSFSTRTYHFPLYPLTLEIIPRNMHARFQRTVVVAAHLYWLCVCRPSSGSVTADPNQGMVFRGSGLEWASLVASPIWPRTNTLNRGQGFNEALTSRNPKLWRGGYPYRKHESWHSPLLPAR